MIHPGRVRCAELGSASVKQCGDEASETTGEPAAAGAGPACGEPCLTRAASPGQRPAAQNPARDEQAEIDRLRAELEELRGKQDSRQASQGRRRQLGWRGPVAVFLIVLGCVFAPVSVLAVGARTRSPIPAGT